MENLGGSPTIPEKPKRLDGVQVACQELKDGQVIYILHNPATTAYLQIDAQNYFLWELMDGEHELAALAMAYLSEYGSLPFERLDALIPQLKENFLLEGTEPATSPSTAGTGDSHVERMARNAFQREFNWDGADAFFTRFYQRIGWIFYTPPALIGMILIVVAGVTSFIYLTWADVYHLLRVDDSFGLGLLALLVGLYIILFWHESGHGLTCKSFGRRIHKAGLMFYYGSPTFYIDVSDMWLAPRGLRIWVSLAGPIVNLLFGSVFAILALLLPQSTAAQMLFIAAFAAYINGLMNLNPLMELDGYYILIDLMQTSHLRSKSFAFIRKDLWSKIRRREKFTGEEKHYSIYGILAIIYTTLMVLLVIFFWERELRLLAQSLLTGEDMLATMLVGILTFVAATWLVLGLVSRGILWTRGRHQHRAKATQSSRQ